MLIPPEHFKGWKVTTVGDDIAWMQIRDGRLYAVNPENGYFGVVPGTNYKSNPNAMKSIERDTLYTNVALTDDGDVWWEGKDGPPPAHAIDWRGNDWTPDSKEKAAHPNSRFTTPMRNNPVLDPDVEKGDGVPISAIIFGGRRSDTMPLVFQAFDWEHGVYLGATMASETTAAATGAVGQVRRDPMAMLPFCGYNIGDYFQHWLKIGKRLNDPPLIFHVNWFRKGTDGKFLWPGFGENMRVLKWIIDRCEGTGSAVKSPIGWLPGPHDLDLDELNVEHKYVIELLGIDHEEWKKELADHENFSIRSAASCPQELQNSANNSRRVSRSNNCSGDSWRPLPMAHANCVPPTAFCLLAREFANRARIRNSLRWVRRLRKENGSPRRSRGCVEIRGARQNNLKGIDLDLPLGKLTVITGPERQRQIEPRLRNHLRRRPAALRRNLQPLHAAIPRPHGQAARG